MNYSNDFEFMKFMKFFQESLIICRLHRYPKSSSGNGRLVLLKSVECLNFAYLGMDLDLLGRMSVNELQVEEIYVPICPNLVGGNNFGC